MQLLVDTDIFCKLGVAGLLDEALAVLGVPVCDCGRLAALPHMLQRGRLVKLYGADACAELLPMAKEMGVVGPAGEEWLEPLVDVPSIDPGEAQLLAVVAQHGLIMLSGDKRALRAVAGIAQVVPALHGKVVTFEAILVELCGRLGRGRRSGRRSATPRQRPDGEDMLFSEQFGPRGCACLVPRGA